MLPVITGVAGDGFTVTVIDFGELQTELGFVAVAVITYVPAEVKRNDAVEVLVALPAGGEEVQLLLIGVKLEKYEENETGFTGSTQAVVPPRIRNESLTSITMMPSPSHSRMSFCM